MIKIMTDMASDITREQAESLEIEVMPFGIIVDDKQIVADINLNPRDFYEIIDNCQEAPKTNQLSPADIEARYRKLGKENTIIHITISAACSGANNTANIVANELNDEGFDITVIDSTMLSYTIGKAVVDAAQMAKEGKTKQEIIDYVKGVYKRDTAYFLVDDLTMLKKGGRIKATAMVVSQVLDIKPILTLNDGMVEAISKIRGLRKAISTLVDYIEERMDEPDKNELYILSANAEDKVEILKELLEERIQIKEYKYFDVGPVITSHIGTGVLGVYFKHKKPYTEYNK